MDGQLEDVRTLARTPLLSGLSCRSLAPLLELLETTTLEAGQRLHAEGDTAAHLTFVLGGTQRSNARPTGSKMFALALRSAWSGSPRTGSTPRRSSRRHR